MNALRVAERPVLPARAIAALAGLLLTLATALGTAAPAHAAPRADGPVTGAPSLACTLFGVCSLDAAANGYRTLEKFP